MEEAQNTFSDFANCTWCKQQIKASEKKEHIEKCAQIPATEKERLLKELHVENA